MNILYIAYCGIDGYFLLQRKFVQIKKSTLFIRLRQLSSVQLEIMER